MHIATNSVNYGIYPTLIRVFRSSPSIQLCHIKRKKILRNSPCAVVGICTHPLAFAQIETLYIYSLISWGSVWSPHFIHGGHLFGRWILVTQQQINAELSQSQSQSTFSPDKRQIETRTQRNNSENVTYSPHSTRSAPNVRCMEMFSIGKNIIDSNQKVFLLRQQNTNKVYIYKCLATNNPHKARSQSKVSQ